MHNRDDGGGLGVDSVAGPILQSFESELSPSPKRSESEQVQFLELMDSSPDLSPSPESRAPALTIITTDD